MERNARYVFVGLATAVLLVGLVVFVAWLARFQMTRAFDVYDVDFQGPVRGLSNGGEVYFNGIKVGEVTKLRLDQHDPNRVMARIRTASDAPVRVDSIASLEPLGVTGVNYIQITAGTLSKPLLKDATPQGVMPVVHSVKSQLDSLLEGGGTVLARTVEALDRVNTLLSPQNVSAVSGTLANVQDVTGQLKDQLRLLADLDATMISLKSASDRISTLSNTSQKLIDGDGRRALTSLLATSEEVRVTAADIRAAVKGVSAPAGAFAATGLPQLSRAVVSLQQAAEDLDRLVGQVEQDPRGVLAKAPAKTIEVKP